MAANEARRDGRPAGLAEGPDGEWKGNEGYAASATPSSIIASECRPDLTCEIIDQ